jgi:glucose/arabinose dehydrogenase/chitodextrinase
VYIAAGLEGEEGVMSGHRSASRGVVVAGGHRRGLLRRWVAMVVAALSLAGIVVATATDAVVHAAPPAFVQARAREITSGTSNALAFTNPNTAGNLIVVYVVWSNNSTVTLTDTLGNAYTPAQAVTKWAGNWSSQVFYAKNIAGGANTVTARFSSNINSFGIVYLHEYSGLDKANPLDVSRSANGTSAAMSTGNATTNNANDLIFGGGASRAAVTAAGAGLTTRATDFGNRTMDRVVTTAGNYAVTATQDGNAWVLHLVAFKAAPTDTVPPAAPTGLSATAASVSRIDLSWTAATDNIGVTGYRILRNGTQVGTTTGATTFSDTGLTPATTASYTVTAVDGAGNVSPPSSAATGTTLADTTAPSVPGNLVATASGPTQVVLTWTASTDDVAVTGYDIYRDGVNVTTVGSPTYTNTSLIAGKTYAFAVRARDAAGNVSGPSSTVPVTTPAPDTAAPTVDITAPTPGATVSGAVVVNANAGDDVGVAGVQFLLDGAALGDEDTAAPFSVSWDTTTTTNGAHHLTARARDAAGNSTTSADRAVTVANTAPPPPAGLLAGYAFDEGAGGTAADASGHGLTANLANGAGWLDGKTGKALSLAGGDDVASLGNPAALHLTGSMTLSAWIYSSTFPGDDAAIISKRGSAGFQLDTTIDTGPRVIGFKLNAGNGANMFRYGATPMQPNIWYHVTGVYDAAAQTMHVYLNGQLDDGQLQGTVAANQQDSPQDVQIGQRPGWGGFGFMGRIDDVRIYGRALSASEVATDMNTPLAGSAPSDPVPPLVTLTAPANNSQVSDIVNVTADADDNVGVAGVQFYVDGTPAGVEDTTEPYALTWDTRTASNGPHTLTARARDLAGNSTLSAAVAVNVANSNFFQNEILATGFDLPTAMKFLPDGRLLVSELAGKISVLPPPYTTPDRTPFLQISNVGSAGVQQGIYDFALDPNYATNRFYYVFYTTRTPNRDRLSRFTANAAGTGTVAGSEVVLYQDPFDANAEHHGGAITFGNDGKLYFTTGEHFDAQEAQDLTNPRGKVHRINLDGTIPLDDPFNDGSGPNWDSIWAYGLRNPYRAYFDAPSNRLFIGDVGGNDYSTAVEEVEIGARGANYGWPDFEGPCSGRCTGPLYSYRHNGRDSAVTGGFVYHGSQFPASYQGSYFFADYTQNWIRRLTFDAGGNLTGVANFEPADGSVDGPYGDIVYLIEGPEGALYYLDLGYSDISGTFGLSKLRRIRYVQSNQAPVATAAATPTSGPTPLTVSFSSAGSADPEGKPLTYSWTFGDGGTSSDPNPTHTYAQPGQYTVRLAVSDGVSSTNALPLTVSAGAPPTGTILAPTDGATFVSGDVISFSGAGTDPEDGALPASAFTWNIDFLHEGHVHPGIPIVGVKSGTFTIPSTGHDFEGNTRYRITLTVTDSNGLTNVKSALIWPTKVDLTFDTVPSGLTLYLDGIAKTTPFVYDTLVGFQHNIEARNQVTGTNNATFAAWSDGGTQTHTLVVPATDSSYVATYTLSPVAPSAPAFVQQAYATPQSTSVTTQPVAFPAPQAAGNLDAVVVGWNDITANVASVTDSAGNTYQPAAPVTRGNGVSQAIYYAANVKAGANAVTVTFDRPAAYPDVRIAEYAGLDTGAPLDGQASAVGSAATASSGNLTTTKAVSLLLGAGTTTGGFSGAGSGYTLRVITQPDIDILEDRTVTATGTYSATAPGVGNWVMQVVAFRAAGQ